MATSPTEKSSCFRFADVGLLPKRMIAPIEGFEKLPIMSLEEAVEPLVNIVPKITRNVFVVKRNCHEPEDGLTSDESASIMLYTFESTPREYSLYVILNTTLRSEQRKNLVPWFPYLRLILTALARLPSQHCTVFRGVKEDLRADYPLKKEFIWWGFSSCTTSVGTLEYEQFFGRKGTRTLFNIECNTGKNIKNHSFYRTEDEILLLPATEFVVKSCLDSGNGLYIIQAQEIESQYHLCQRVLVPPSQTSYVKRAPALPATKILVVENQATKGAKSTGQQ